MIAKNAFGGDGYNHVETREHAFSLELWLDDWFC